MPIRKIIHVDMDAFFASVEQLDDPSLRGRPVAVGGSSGRGVVAAASYEARAFGVRSAMPSVTAQRLCPDLVFVRSRFERYRELSAQTRGIFRDETPLIEPPSLDEAYLDVTALPEPATAVARRIRARVRDETGLTCSAGVSFNKLLAKLASDENKPDGLTVIPPDRALAYVAGLPVKRFHGVGPVTAAKLEGMGLATGADLRAAPLAWLTARFGSFGQRLHDIARGLDDRPVRTHRIAKSIGGERTFDTDCRTPEDLDAQLVRIAAIVWDRIAAKEARGRTVTLKVKFADFTLITRARSLVRPLAGEAELLAIARDLLAGEGPLPRGVRLLGLSLSKLGEVEEPELREPELPL